MTAHNHAHSDGHHHHHHHAATGKTLIAAFVITLAFAGLEAIGGWISGSLALMGDAGHMLSDAAALGLAAFAAWIALRPPSQRHSYGMVRAEVIAALVNSIFMLAIVVAIVTSAIERLQQPREIDAEVVIWVASAGFIVNILVAWLLMRGEQNMNVRGALLHVFGDLLGSVAAIISGVVIMFTGWMLIDPLLSILICLLILNSTVRLLREVINVIMEGVPLHLDLAKVGEAMAARPDVLSVHDLHIWTLASGRIALSAHVNVNDFSQWNAVLSDLRDLLEHQFGIDHVTLQPETPGQETEISVEEVERQLLER